MFVFFFSLNGDERDITRTIIDDKGIAVLQKNSRECLELRDVINSKHASRVLRLDDYRKRFTELAPFYYICVRAPRGVVDVMLWKKHSQEPKHTPRKVFYSPTHFSYINNISEGRI